MDDEGNVVIRHYLMVTCFVRIQFTWISGWITLGVHQFESVVTRRPSWFCSSKTDVWLLIFWIRLLIVDWGIVTELSYISGNLKYSRKKRMEYQWEQRSIHSIPVVQSDESNEPHSYLISHDFVISTQNWLYPMQLRVCFGVHRKLDFLVIFLGLDLISLFGLGFVQNIEQLTLRVYTSSRFRLL